MAELVIVGEKGQIVIPKKFRDDLDIEKGTKIIIEEKDKKLMLRKVVLSEDQLWMLVGEDSLKKTWDNPHDKRWDDVL